MFQFLVLDFIALKKRDKHCNDVMPSENCVSGNYRARFGMTPDLKARLWGCFCEENLSTDLNFNFGRGYYREHANLLNIT